MSPDTGDFSQLIADMQAKLAASPHVCPGCGERVLQPGSCGDCRQAADERRRLEKERQAAVAELRRSAGSHYDWCSFTAPELPQRVLDCAAIEAAKATALRLREIGHVVLQGASHVGKTTLGMCMAVHLLEIGVVSAAIFVDGAELAQARMHHKGFGEPELVQRAMHAPLLVLDELGRGDAYPRDAVPDTVQRRHRLRQPTIITTPFTESVIRTKYGDGFANRVYIGGQRITVTKPSAPSK
jgi:DNA replication protein DnaC